MSSNSPSLIRRLNAMNAATQKSGQVLDEASRLLSDLDADLGQNLAHFNFQHPKENKKGWTVWSFCLALLGGGFLLGLGILLLSNYWMEETPIIIVIEEMVQNDTLSVPEFNEQLIDN